MFCFSCTNVLVPFEIFSVRIDPPKRTAKYSTQSVSHVRTDWAPILVLIFDCTNLLVPFEIFSVEIHPREYQKQHRSVRTVCASIHVQNYYCTNLLVPFEIFSVEIHPKEYQKQHPVSKDCLCLHTCSELLLY